MIWDRNVKACGKGLPNISPISHSQATGHLLGGIAECLDIAVAKIKRMEADESPWPYILCCWFWSKITKSFSGCDVIQI